MRRPPARVEIPAFVMLALVVASALTAMLVERALAPDELALVIGLGAAIVIGGLIALVASRVSAPSPDSPAEPITPAPSARTATNPTMVAAPEHGAHASPRDGDRRVLVERFVGSALRQAALAIEQLGAGEDDQEAMQGDGARVLRSLGHGAASRGQEILARIGSGAPEPYRGEAVQHALREEIAAAARALAFELGREVAVRFDNDFPAQAIADRTLVRLALVTLLSEVAGARDDGGELLLEASHDDLEGARVEVRIAASANGAMTIGALEPLPVDGDGRPALAALAALWRASEGRVFVGDAQAALTLTVERHRRVTGTTLYGLGALEGKTVLVIDPRPIGRVTICEQLATWRLAPTGVPSVDEARALLEKARQGGARVDLVVVAGFGEEQLALVGALGQGSERLRGLKLVSLESAEGLARPLPPELAAVPGLVLERLPRPPSPAELIRVLASLVAPRPEASHKLARAASGSASGLSIIVAEDNVVNQALLAKLLERRGHAVTVVGNGADLVDRLWDAPGAFDLALVDIQMPVMDGYEAAAVIRLREAQSGRTPTPIIAVTAHAMGGERERCLEAGMDGYLSKPIDDKELAALIEASLAKRRQAPRTAVSGEAVSARGGAAEAIFDRAHVLEIAAGDVVFLEGLVGIFAESAPKLVGEIESHITAGDAGQVYRKAHQLKGSISNFGAERARATAAAMERHGHEGDLGAAAALLPELAARVDELVEGLRALAVEASAA